MEVLFHGVFLIFKLAVLGSIYATIVLIVLWAASRIFPNSNISNFIKNKKTTWFISGALTSLGLFFYATTHWGNHGLGDSARIPLRHGKAIEQINGTMTFTDTQLKYGHLCIGKFALKEDLVIGETRPNTVDDVKPFFVWNLKSDETVFYDQEGFSDFLIKNKSLPRPYQFEEFDVHYKKYWLGWRFLTTL